MPDFDPSTLPAPLATYFTLGDRREALPLFAGDAVVHDENEIHRGTDAIRAWLDSVERRYQPRQVAQAAENANGRTFVTFEVSGSFPGSPAILQQAFTLTADGKIAALTTL